MAPSRGRSSSSTPNSNANANSDKDSDSGDSAIDASSTSALRSARQNLSYLYSPSTSSSQPARFRTRALLRTLRFSLVFIFWRLVRYAKYVAVGSLVAAIGAGAFGSVVSGAAFVIAPTGIVGSIVAGTVWGVGRWGARRLQRRWAQPGSGYGETEEQAQEKRSPAMRGEWGSEAVPW